MAGNSSSFDWSFAARLADRGWRFTLHHADLSGAVGHGTKSSGLTLAEAKAQMSPILSVLGAKGGVKLNAERYTLVLDADLPGAIAKLESSDKRLAETLRTQGSKPGHLYIETDYAIKKQTIDTSNGERVIDILGQGGMAVCPHSLHRKTRQPYQIIRDAEPAYIPWAELALILAKICEAEGWKWVEYEKLFSSLKTFHTTEGKPAEIKAKLSLFDINPALKPGLQSCPLPGHVNGDKHPSLHVSRDGMLFNCFSKHGGGDIFTWLGQSENLKFPEALRKLAGMAGITLTTLSDKRKEEPDCPEFLEMKKSATVILMLERGKMRRYLVVKPDCLEIAEFDFKTRGD